MSGPVEGGFAVEAVRDARGAWSINGVGVTVPEGASEEEFILGKVFSRVEGPGPWLCVIRPEEGTAYQFVLGTDGSMKTADAAPADEAPTAAVVPARRGSRAKNVLLAASAAVVLAGLVAGAVVVSSMSPGATAESSAPAAAVQPLWIVPDGTVPVEAAGPVVAAVDAGELVLFSGTDGTRIDSPVPVKVPDISRLRVAAGDDLSIVDAGTGHVVTIQDGQSSGRVLEGALLARGPVPVLISGEGQTRKSFIFRDGAPAEVHAPTKGNSLFGGLAGGGSVWAVAGGKVTYVPAQGETRTVPLAAPVPNAAVGSWVAVNEDRTVVIWQAAGHRVLSVHATGSTGSGEVLFQRDLAEGEEAAGGPEQVLIGKELGGAAAKVSAVLDPGAEKVQAVAPPCPDPVLPGFGVWCPDGEDSWSSKNFTVPGKPIAAGDGFVLVAERTGTAVLPGPKP